MSPNDILKEVLEDPILAEKYDIPIKKLKSTELHSVSNIPVIEIIRTILTANSNNTAEINIFRQIKTYLGIS